MDASSGASPQVPAGSCTWETRFRRCSPGRSRVRKTGNSSCASRTSTNAARIPPTSKASSTTFAGSASNGTASPFMQTERVAAYEVALGHIADKAELYPCFCSRADLHAASAPHASDGTPLYAGTCFSMDPDERDALGTRAPTRAAPTRSRRDDIVCRRDPGAVCAESRERVWGFRAASQRWRVRLPARLRRR